MSRTGREEEGVCPSYRVIREGYETQRGNVHRPGKIGIPSLAACEETRRSANVPLLMVTLKSIVGAIGGALIGTAVGFVAFLVFTIPVSIIGSFTGMKENAEVYTRQCIPYGAVIGAVIGFVVALVLESKRQAALDEEEQKQRRAKESQEKQERDRADAELEGQKDHLASILATTQRDFLTIPELVSSADANLDRAERDFADGAFAPFWDQVEHATNKLAAYRKLVRDTGHSAEEYERKASYLSVPVPKFALPKRELPDARPVAQRLSTIVRTAQRNFQFATIFEQRKTNQLLYAGFGTLGAAISSLGSAISSSLSDLSNSVHSSLDDILQATRDHTDTMESIAERQEQAARDRHDEQSRRDASEAEAKRKYEKEHLAKEGEQTEKLEEQAKALDGMWRKKKPPYHDPRV